MRKTSWLILASIALTSGSYLPVANAATPNGLCSPTGSKATISSKTYICAKVLSGKTVWIPQSPSTLSNAPKPAISGSTERRLGENDGEGREGNEGPGPNTFSSPAIKKFTDCLAKNRGSVTGSRTTATQQKALHACASLSPKHTRHSGDDN